ncbi:hypothetical protein [Longispora urticae]
MSTTALSSSPADGGLSAASRPARLGPVALAGMTVTAAGVLPVVLVGVPAGYAATRMPALPWVFLLVAGVLALFLPGYLAAIAARSRVDGLHVLIGAGMGRTAGVAAGWVAVLGYGAAEVAAYAAFGSYGATAIETIAGVRLTWWSLALACWAMVAVLGAEQVTVAAKVIGVICAAQLLIVAGMTAFNITDAFIAADPILVAEAINPVGLIDPWFAVALIAAAAAFCGLEQAVAYTRAARPGAVRRASWAGLGVLAVCLTVAGWAALLPQGVGAVRRDGAVAAPWSSAVTHLGTPAAIAVSVVFTVSLLGAALMLHTTTARYVTSLSRASLTRPRATLGSAGSGQAARVRVGQCVAGGLVLGVTAVFGWDPWAIYRQTGEFVTVVVLALLAATALALCNQPHRRGGQWHPGDGARTIARCVSAVLLGATAMSAVEYFAALHDANWTKLAVLGPIATAGGTHAWWLRRHRPRAYARLASCPPRDGQCGCEVP